MDDTKFSVIILFFLEKTGKMAQCEKAPAAKPDELNSIPGAHMLEGENSPQLSSYSLICALCFNCSRKGLILYS